MKPLHTLPAEKMMYCEMCGNVYAKVASTTCPICDIDRDVLADHLRYIMEAGPGLMKQEEPGRILFETIKDIDEYRVEEVTEMMEELLELCRKMQDDKINKYGLVTGMVETLS